MIAHASALGHGLVLSVAVLAIVGYGVGWIYRPATRRLLFAAWTAGIITFIVATLPAVERWAERSFTGHMVQHLLMINVAAPLLVLAEPLLTIRRLPGLNATTTNSERIVARFWRANGPLLAAALFVLTLYLTHLTNIYDEALRSTWVHDLEHGAYLATAVLLWSTLRSGARQFAYRRVSAVFAVIGASALLGVVLLTASTPLVATYAERLGDAQALEDQRTAASLMWIGGMATTMPLLLLAVWSWASTEQRIAMRSEAINDRPGRPTAPALSDHRVGSLPSRQ